MIARKWRLLIGAAATLGAVVLAVLYAALGAYVYLEPTLPSAATLRGQNRQVPLRIYTRDGALISQFGEQLRVPVHYEEISSANHYTILNDLLRPEGRIHQAVVVMVGVRPSESTRPGN